MNKTLKDEHCGFAISLEVMLTLCVLFSFFSFFLYTSRIMNLQKYMNTCMTSAAIQASRYGGNSTKAFRVNVTGGTTISDYYNTKLNQISKEFGSFTGAQANFNLSVSPERINYDGQQITVRLTYQIPGSFSSYSKVFNTDMYDNGHKYYEIKVNPIMRAGELLND